MNTKEAFVFLDLIGELMTERDRRSKKYRWVLASDCPDEKGNCGWAPVEHFLELAPGTTVADSELIKHPCWEDGPLVKIKSVRTN